MPETADRVDPNWIDLVLCYQIIENVIDQPCDLPVFQRVGFLSSLVLNIHVSRTPKPDHERAVPTSPSAVGGETRNLILRFLSNADLAECELLSFELNSLDAVVDHPYMPLATGATVKDQE